MRTFACLAFAAIFTPVLPGQPASYSMMGTACTTGRLSPGLGAVPFAVRNTPRIGTTFEIVTESSASYPWGNRRSVLLLTGFSNTIASGVPLPFDLSGLRPGEPVCGLLYTSDEVVTPVGRQTSYLTQSIVGLPIPNDPSLIGIVFYQQVASIETTTFGWPNFALQLSRGGRGVIGT